MKYLAWIAGLGLVCVLLAVIVTGRTHPAWMLPDISGHLPDLHFALTADNAQPVTERSYQGKVVLLYFGFTQCPDKCPLTLTRLATVLRNLGDDAKDVKVLFVTVDPKHDTPAALHAYLASLDGAHMTGLTGSNDQIAALAKRYHSAWSASVPMHSDTIYIFDRHGKARLHASSDDTDAALTQDISRLTHEKPSS